MLFPLPLIVTFSLLGKGLEPHLSRVMERHSLTGDVTVTTYPLQQTVTLTGPGATKRLETSLVKKSELCPEVTRTAPDTLVLHCKTPKLLAEVTRAPTRRGNRRPALQLQELRINPWNDGSALPLSAYSPRAMAAAYDCDSPRTPPVAAECALAQGDLLTFGAEVERAKDTPYGHLRAGDLAMLTGEVSMASEHYQKSMGAGPFPRLAFARLCELGVCNERQRSLGFDSAGLTLETFNDMERRRLRLSAFDGRYDEVIASLRALGSRICVGAEAFCDELLLGAFRSKSAADRGNALVLHAELPWMRSNRGGIVVEEAARVAEEAQAYTYAAALLSSETHRIPSWKLGQHLRRIEALYAKADDGVRAEVIRYYAASKGQLQPGRPTRAPVEPVTPAGAGSLVRELQSLEEIDTELARAAAARARAKARLMTSQQE